MWISTDKELPDELFSYGCESVDVMVAAKPYNVWEYGIAYCVRHKDGVSWVSSNERILNKPLYWSYINPPEIEVL